MPNFALWTPQQLTILILGAVGIVGFVVVTISTTLADRAVRAKALKLQSETATEMVAKGYSAEDIEKAIGAIKVRPSRTGDAVPSPCDIVTVDERGNTSRSLILAASMHGEQFLVHHVGHGVDRNEWLPRDCCRFPSSFAFDSFNDPSQPFPFAQPAVVERDGEWLNAYIVSRGEMSLVHFVGEDWEDSEWVEEARIRYAPPGMRGEAKVSAKPEPLDI